MYRETASIYQYLRSGSSILARTSGRDIVIAAIEHGGGASGGVKLGDVTSQAIIYIYE